MIILNFWILNYQTLIKAYINTPTKEIGIFSVLNKIIQVKRKKKPKLLYPGLGYAHRNINFACKKKFRKCLFAYKIRFVVKKKFGGKFSKLLKKFFVSPSKNANHTISIYGNCMESIFFKKNFKSVFFLSPVCLFNCSQKAAEMVYFFLLFFENVWKLYDKHFLHILDV